MVSGDGCISESELASPVHDTEKHNWWHWYIMNPFQSLNLSALLHIIVSMVTMSFIVLLLLLELIDWYSLHVHEAIGVDLSFGDQLSIHAHLYFPSTQCDMINFDVVDRYGGEQLAVGGGTFATNTGHVYAAPPTSSSQPSATNASSRGSSTEGNEGYADEEDLIDGRLKKTSSPSVDVPGKMACSAIGRFVVNKVDGNFHFALGRGVKDSGKKMDPLNIDPFAVTQQGAIHDHVFSMIEMRYFNASHTIRRLSFGHRYPGMPSQPLDGMTRAVKSGFAQYNYHLSIVPTEYVTITGRKIRSYQYSWSEKIVEVDSVTKQFPHPGVFFHLTISPLVMRITEQPPLSFTLFMVRIIGSIGSIWVISSLVDRALHWYHRTRLHLQSSATRTI